MISAGLFGAAIAAGLAHWVASWWPFLLVASALTGLPPTRVWLRLRAEARRVRER